MSSVCWFGALHFLAEYRSAMEYETARARDFHIRDVAEFAFTLLFGMENLWPDA
jgi:hypothetical protein